MNEKRYVYQPQIAIPDYERAADVLAGRIENRVVRGWPDIDHRAVEDVCEQFARLGVRIAPLDAVTSGYPEYMARADYARTHPGYAEGNLTEKSFEHHLACRLLQLTPGEVFIDVASARSPLPEIASRLFDVHAYSQDIEYAPGVSDGYIGGDACEMPVADAFATKAALTCSLEHFEGDADTRLFRELARVLTKGGRVVVVPLYMVPEHSVMTDPRWSTAADVSFDHDAVVYCSNGWDNRHGRLYSPRSLLERVMLPNMDAFRFTLFRIVRGPELEPSIYALFALLAERVADRQPWSHSPR